MKPKLSKSMSAGELMSRLQSDPEWVRKNAEREANRITIAKQRREEVREEETPLLADLVAVGINVESIWDLVNTKSAYPAAIPILSEYLQRVKHPRLREGIARALTVREARGAGGHVVLTELQRSTEQSPHAVRWALANALTVIANAGLKL